MQNKTGSDHALQRYDMRSDAMWGCMLRADDGDWCDADDVAKLLLSVQSRLTSLLDDLPGSAEGDGLEQDLSATIAMIDTAIN